ncbi:hypothetical protein CUC08_Gglean005729 [Alternaria sp. MG1]|nr:hypothetical protein CUC08_Gglean005729 [Alternaria sp. MG1]
MRWQLLTSINTRCFFLILLISSSLHLLISLTLHLFNSTSLIVAFKLQSLIGGSSLLLESSSLSSLLRSSREKLDHRLAKNRAYS